MLLCASLFIPLVSNLAPNASASWLKEADVMSFTTYQSKDPSIAIDANGTLHYTYTAFVPLANDYEIAYYNNSEGEAIRPPKGFPSFEYLSEGEGVSSVNSTQNGNSQICVDNNTIHVVWEGIANGDTDKDIFYTNNSGGSLKDYASNIMSDGTDQTDPSIVAINNSVFIVYQQGTDIRMCTNYDDGVLKDDYTVVSSGSGTKPRLSLWSNGTDWRIDLVYIDLSQDIRRSYINKGVVDPYATFISNVRTLTTTATDFSVDSSKDRAFVCFTSGTNIWVANATTTGFGSAIQVTNGLINGAPDIVVNENNIATIFYVTNATDGNSTIRTRNNYNTYFTREELLITKAQIASNVVSLKIMSLDAELCQGEGVFIMYETTTKAGPTEIKNVLRLNAYGNTYNNGAGEFNYYTFEDMLGGRILDEGWLLEGIELSYNTSSGNDVYLKFRITDDIAKPKVVWENISKLDGDGGKDYRLNFFQPNNYFIARHTFKFEILNGSSQQDLIKIELDPLVFSNRTDNATSNYNNQTHFAYTFQTITGELGLEVSIFFAENILTNNIWKKGDSIAKVDSVGTLDSNNYVDVYKFNMLGGDQYNMSLTTVGAGSSNCQISVFNSTQQITHKEEALYTYNMSTYNKTYFQIYSPKDDIFYVVIEKTAFNADFDYTFKHKICPMSAIIIKPSINSYISQPDVQFEWSLDSDDQEFSSSQISRYIFEMYNSLNNRVIYYNNLKTTNINLTIIRGTYPDFDLRDGVYRWQVIIVSKTLQLSKGVLTQLNIDTTPPDAPEVLFDPTEYFTLGEFTVRWTTPLDGEFTVNHYELYKGYSSDFECDSSSRLDVDQTGNSYFEYSKDTGIYYYKVIAVDQAGLKSDPSEAGYYIVSIGGIVLPFDQEFQVLPGDYLEYQLVDVYEEGNKDPNTLVATIHGREFQINTMFYYYVTTVSNQQVIPVRADWYFKWMNTTAEQLEEEYNLIGGDMDVFPLVTSPDTDYQEDMFKLYVEREFGNASEFEYEMKKSKYYDWFTTIDVVIHTFYIPIDYEAEGTVDYYYDSVVFIVDKETGVVIEMTEYNNHDNIGYSLKLVNTSVGLSKTEWWIVPLIIIAALGIVAAILNQIVKKLERRV